MGDNSSVDVLGLITTGQTKSNCIMNINSYSNINLKSELFMDSCIMNTIKLGNEDVKLREKFGV
ncbi:hypothetical protein TGAM01_v211178 [Trichoderma gamsii]|uniref:Uncharacterized protein n=1 Tax=Trichoderma gamsii TaxID=398673 RepID=A0A2P4Z6N3_9HYPO|nr:hypothetical protein TGAM01_v211178 [Trichoderma gamsii]PON19957.1 hypothetical protein TGAM01_v211178 [Trichoderma gamsii]